MPYKMKVEFFEHKLVGIGCRPVSKEWRERIQQYMEEMHGELPRFVPRKPDYTEALITTEDAKSWLSPSEIRTLEDGWTVTKHVDPWEFLTTYGWDAHTLAE